MITADYDRLIAPQRGDTINIIVTYEGSGTYVTPTVTYNTGSGSGWLTVEMLGEVTQDVVEYEVTFSAYTNYYSTPYTKSGYITFSDDDDSLQVPFYQCAGYSCIWADYYMLPNPVSGEDYNYRLKNEDDIIFEGVTVPILPNANPENVNVPRLVESYLSTPEYNTDEEEAWADLGEYHIDFYKVDSGVETWKDRIYFCNDWSGYRRQLSSSTTNRILNDPINDHGTSDGTMYFPFSIYNSDNSSDWGYVVEKTTGTPVTETLPTPDYALCVYNVSNGWDNEKKITFKKGNTELFSYDLTYCGKGELIYRNRFGGYDVFLIEGNIYKNESYDKEQYTTVANNTRRESRSKTTDKNKLTITYEMTTGWLTDDESQRLVYHLLSSPTVYFKPFSGEEYEYGGGYPIAVNITNSTAEYKKFRNGRKLVQYTITLEESKTKEVKK